MRDRADFSLIESLRTIPGFRVQQSGGFGRVATIKTRGLRNQDTALLIDGIRFRDPTAITGDASPFLSDFTLTSVDRVEVLRGSGSSLYGTNAIGGVVDFETPEAKKGTHGQIGGSCRRAGARTFSRRACRTGRRTVNSALSARSRGRSIQKVSTATTMRTTQTFRRGSTVNPGSKTNISGRIFYSNADVRLNTSPDTRGHPPLRISGIINAQRGVNFTPDRTIRTRYSIRGFLAGSLPSSDHKHQPGSQRLTTKGSRRIGETTTGRSGRDFKIRRQASLTGRYTPRTRISYGLPNGKNTLTTGYEFELEKFGNNGSTPGGCR